MMKRPLSHWCSAKKFQAQTAGIHPTSSDINQDNLSGVGGICVSHPHTSRVS